MKSAKYQFFISYKTRPKRSVETNSKLKEKLRSFSENLRDAFDDVFGEDCLDSFLDEDKLKEGKQFWPQLEEALRESLFLFIVLDQRWIKNENCKHEFKYFKDKVCNGDIDGRVYVIRHGHLDDPNGDNNFSEEEKEILTELAGIQYNSRLEIDQLNKFDFSTTAKCLKEYIVQSMTNSLVGGSLDPSVPQDHPSQEELYEIIVYNEAEYLRNSIARWIRGEVTRSSFSKPQLDHNASDGPSPYEFDINALLKLSARSSSSARSVMTKSIYEFFRDGQKKPILLIGEAGAGKSTVLATTAASYAYYDPRLSRKVHSNIKSLAQDHAASLDDGNSNFPVLIKASDIANELSESTESVDSIFAAVVKAILPAELLKGLSMPHLVDALKRRVLEYPYILLIDALEELFDQPKAVAILHLVDQLHQDYGSEGVELKVIVTSRRKMSFSDDHSFNVLRLEPPTNDQIEKFFVNYSQRSSEESNKLHARFNERRKKAEEHGYRDLFRTPFLLNAFCWYLTTHEQFDGDRSALVEAILQHDLRSEDRLNQSGHTEELLIATLQALAYSAMSIHDSGRKETYSNPYPYCIDAVKQAYAMVLPDVRMKDSEAQSVLRYLCNETQILTRNTAIEQSEHFFTTGLVCEFLAGQWIVRSNLVSELIEDKINTIEDLKKWDRSLGVVYQELEATSENAENTEQVIQMIFEKVQSEEDTGKLAGWLTSIATILKEAARTSISEGKNKRPGFHKFLEKMSGLYRQKCNEWPAKVRNEVLSALFSTCIRSDHRLTSLAVDDLYEDLGVKNALSSLHPKTWVKIEVPELANLRISPMPVLSCEFLEFVKANENNLHDSEYWSHVPENLRGLSKEHDSEEYQRKAWQKKSVDVWNELEETPALPMVFINWYEATTYARWLTQSLRSAGQISEHEIIRPIFYSEWDRIISVITDGGKHPLGVEPPNTNQDNWFDTGIGKPSVPLTFDEKDGLYDFASNVHSWSASYELEDEELIWPIENHGPDDEFIPMLGNSYRTRSGNLSHGKGDRVIGALERRSDLGLRLVIEDRFRAD